MFGWLKNRSRTQKPEVGSGKSGSGEGTTQAHGKFRLEPLEPRVLLSGDSIVAVVAIQALQETQANSVADAPSAIVEQLDAGTENGGTSTDRGQDSGTASGAKTSVAWPESWQAGAAGDAKDDTKSALPGDQETPVASTSNIDSAGAQSAQVGQAEAIVAAQEKRAVANDSSVVGTAGDDQIVTVPTTTQQPRGPPADDQHSSALVAEETLHNNDLQLSDATNKDAGESFALLDPPFSEPNGDSLPRGPPTDDTAAAEQAQYLRSVMTDAAPAQNPAPSLTDQSLAPVLARAIGIWNSLASDPDFAARLSNVRVTIADLPDGILGQADGYQIFIDFNADGHAWFVDATPADSAEFGVAINPERVLADAGSAAFGRFDLLTVLLHETGHVLGLSHAVSLAVMDEAIRPGERVLPESNIPLFGPNE